MYRIPNRDLVDGLVIFSATIAYFVGQQEMKTFCAKYEPLPMLSVGMEIDGLPALLTDNRTGMREVMKHLIEDHQFRKFAFLAGKRGNRDAAERFETFEKTLREYGIPLDPGCVYEGDFTADSGSKFARSLPDPTHLDVDVIVCANDNMALGAMEGLAKRGIRIPEQIAITGFDNIDISCSPSLTTVQFPFYQMGWTAGQRLLDQMEGKPGPGEELVPTRAVIRESCRCPSSHSRTQRNSLDFTGIGETGSRRIPEPSAETPSDGEDFYEVKRMIGELWNRRSFSEGGDRSEEEARRQHIAEVSEQIVRRQRQKTEDFLLENNVVTLMRELLAATTLSRQMELIAARLPDLSIDSCYLSLYQGQTGYNENSLCLLRVLDGVRLSPESDGLLYPTRQLLPDDFLTGEHPHVLLVEALKQYGFIVYEMKPGLTRIFYMLTCLISSSIHNAILFRDLQDRQQSLSVNLENMRKTMAGFIQTMSATIEKRDPYTAGHQRRVSALARSIAQEMGLSASQTEAIRMASLIHDLGKIYVPSEILNRTGVLDEMERGMIQRHSRIAYDILKNIEFPWPIADIVYQHHERLDGSGYPCGLKGENILLEARIIAVADVVEAMSSRRPYRAALGVEKALEEINLHKGILYDSTVVENCTSLFTQKRYHFYGTDYLAPIVDVAEEKAEFLEGQKLPGA